MPLLIMLQDPTQVLDVVERLPQKLGLDPGILKYVWWTLAVVFIIWAATWLRKLLWENWIKPLLATQEEKDRLVDRQAFADEMERRIRALNDTEEWRDRRYAELEAEVEADDERQTFSLNPFRLRIRSGLRREKSLTKAIRMSRSRRIQLEGEPGSGKSVALRFIARKLAARASASRSLKSVIPLYLNLKELSRAPDEPVDQTLIRSFVLKTLNRGGHREIEKFLDEEFEAGLKNGTWLFLFDSFDEIPEVLSSTEADEIIKSYAVAINDFLGGMNKCRGVVASRHFRSPGRSSSSSFRILPLSESRRLKLIRNAHLPHQLSQQLTGHLAMTGHELRDLSGNPMLLGLLCEYVKAGNPFPDSVHTVLSSYLEDRLRRDGQRVWRRFGVGVEEVRAAAEGAAFCMAAEVGLGLNPMRPDLELAMRRYGFAPDGDFDRLLEALVFIKLARSEESADGIKSFTFAHRRFQEYFATCVVLREPERVSPRELLSDARWRETAVVMCQSQPAAALGPIVDEARRELAGLAGVFPGGVAPAASQPSASADGQAEVGQADDADAPPDSFAWPRGTLHLLNLLQDGFARRLKDLPDDVRGIVGGMLLAVSRKAGQFDQKCALEVVGAAPPHVLLRLIRRAFRGNSQVLKDVAYKQVARLGAIPDDIADSIRSALLTLVGNGRLGRERLATRAHLARLDKPERFTSSLRLLLSLPHVDLLLHALIFVLWLSNAAWAGAGLQERAERAGSAALLLTLLLASHLSFRLLRLVQVIVGKLLDVLFIIYLRAFAIGMALFMPFIVEAAGGAKAASYFPLLYVLACLYAALWLPSALLAARVGQCTGLVWWPLMPLTPLVLLVGNLPSILRWVRKNLAQLAYVLLALLLLGVYISVIEKNRLASELSWAFLLLLILPVVSVLSYKLLRDKVRWHVRASLYNAPLTADSFRDEFYGYSTSPFRWKFVRAVRARGVLEATHQTDQLVEGLSLSLERESFELARAGLRRKLNLRNFLNFTALPTAELIDELTMLLEQVRAGRRDVAPQAEAVAAEVSGVEV